LPLLLINYYSLRKKKKEEITKGEHKVEGGKKKGEMYNRTCPKLNYHEQTYNSIHHNAREALQ
jgi:hypothetical protein